ncbi:MAG: hypothetical protein AAF322_12315, partial [Pseudomonadota bacterium]
LGDAKCFRAVDLGSFRDFDLAAAKRAGVDVAPILAEEAAADAAAKEADEFGEAGHNQFAPKPKTPSFADDRQRAEHLDHVAAELALACADELHKALLGPPAG